MGAITGAMEPTRVVPVPGPMPVASANVRLSPGEVKAVTLNATVALQDEFIRCIKGGAQVM